MTVEGNYGWRGCCLVFCSSSVRFRPVNGDNTLCRQCSDGNGERCSGQSGVKGEKVGDCRVGYYSAVAYNLQNILIRVKKLVTLSCY